MGVNLLKKKFRQTVAVNVKRLQQWQTALYYIKSISSLSITRETDQQFLHYRESIQTE